MQSTLQLVGIRTADAQVDWVPNTDVFETNTAFVVRMEVAGVAQGDIQIQLSDHHLVVKGKRANPNRNTQCHYHQMEISYGVFETRLALSKGVDGRKIKATCRNGFLVLEIPKVAKPESAPVHVVFETD